MGEEFIESVEYICLIFIISNPYTLTLYSTYFTKNDFETQLYFFGLAAGLQNTKFNSNCLSLTEIKIILYFMI